MKLVTWNTQWCCGVDGIVSPERIVEGARQLADFDVLCLQEISVNYPGLAGNPGHDQPALLAALLPGFPPGLELPDEPGLYAVSYRPAVRDKKPVIDVWLAPFAVGDPLPTMPLRLTGELFVPVDFEAAYTEACRRQRLIG